MYFKYCVYGKPGLNLNLHVIGQHSSTVIYEELLFIAETSWLCQRINFVTP